MSDEQKTAEDWYKELNFGCGIDEYANNPQQAWDDTNKQNIELIKRIINNTLERAVKVVYGQCGSDNVAQRTVEALRALKEPS